MRDYDFFPREDTMERKLAAILSADVKIYGRVMGGDESATFYRRVDRGRCREDFRAKSPDDHHCAHISLGRTCVCAW